MFKEYGIRLTSSPPSRHADRSVSRWRRKSALWTSANAVKISGFNSSRHYRAQSQDRSRTLTTARALSIGGLLDNSETETFQKIPFLGDIPILGKFFQSMHEEQDTIPSSS